MEAMEFDIKDLIYDRTLSQAKFGSIDKCMTRMGKVEYELSKIQNSTKECIESFKLKLENFKDRIQECELETENNKRLAMLVQSHFESHEQHYKLFEERLTNDVN